MYNKHLLYWNQSLDMAPKKAAAPDLTLARLSARAPPAVAAFDWAAFAGTDVAACVGALLRFTLVLVGCLGHNGMRRCEEGLEGCRTAHMFYDKQHTNTHKMQKIHKLENIHA